MGTKTVIDVSIIQKAQKHRAWVNSLNLEDLSFVDGEGNEITYDAETLKEFKFTGLNNTDFILTCLDNKEKK